MLAWECVDVGEKNPQSGLGTATIRVHITPGKIHNVIRNVDQRQVQIDIATSITAVKHYGRRKKEGMMTKPRKKNEALLTEDQAKEAAEAAGIELEGFLVQLLDLEQNQLRTEKGKGLNSKEMLVTNTKLSKMELIFLLQSKIGEIHGEGFGEKRVEHFKTSKMASQRQKEMETHVEKRLKEDLEWMKKEEEERERKKQKLEEIEQKKKSRLEAEAKAKADLEEKKAALAAARSKFMEKAETKKEDSSAPALGGIAQYGSSDSEESSDEPILPTAKLE